jgi:hypothetical protein
MRQKINEYKNLKRRQQWEDLRRGWEYNIKIYFQETELNAWNVFI